MKKILLITLLLVLIFGCAKVSEDKLVDTVDEKEEPSIEVEEKVEAPPVETTEPEPDETATKTAETEETEETEQKETEETEDKLPKLELTGELKELLDKIGSKVKNYKYTYGKPPLTTESNTYLVQLKNSKKEKEYLIRVDLYEYDEMPLMTERWDTVFLNPKTETAKIFCLDKTYCQAKEFDKTNMTEDVEYAEYKLKTPHEWAEEIPADAKMIGPQLLDKKTVTKFEYTGDDGTNYAIWLDNTYGLPMQVIEMTTDGTELKHSFRDVEINSGKDEEFKPPF